MQFYYWGTWSVPTAGSFGSKETQGREIAARLPAGVLYISKLIMASGFTPWELAEPFFRPWLSPLFGGRVSSFVLFKA